MQTWLRLFLLFLFLLSFGCARHLVTDPSLAMKLHVGFVDIVDDLELPPFIEMVKNNISILTKNADKKMVFGPYIIKQGEYAKALLPLTEITTLEELKKIITENFYFMEVYGKEKASEILLTAYYAPVVSGSFSKTCRFSTPLYALPEDLVIVDFESFNRKDITFMEYSRKKIAGRVFVKEGAVPKVIPYYSRQEIDDGLMLKDRNLELVWIDPVDAFVMQIQGSGAVKVGDDILSFGYAGQNGWRYYSIGKSLLHLIPQEEMSLQKIEDYLRQLDDKSRNQILYKNPSYVFFRKQDGMPRTTMGANVVDGRTLAVDSSLFPLGALAYLSFQLPIFENAEDRFFSRLEKTSRFVLAQDTGGAIKGTGRADLFWGSGDRAKQIAGAMRHPASLWFLMPKAVIKNH